MKLIISSILFILFMSFSFAENVNLFWDANTELNVTHYNIHRGDTVGGPYTVIGTSSQASNPMFSDLAVDLTTDKFYVVTALNNAGMESAFSNEVSASSVPPATPPSAPTITITITVSP